MRARAAFWSTRLEERAGLSEELKEELWNDSEMEVEDSPQWRRRYSILMEVEVPSPRHKQLSERRTV